MRSGLAIGRRCAPAPAGAGFHRYRQARSQRARTLGMLLVPLDAGHTIPLRRAPDVRVAREQVYGPATGPAVTPLRELLGVIGAHEWLDVPALGDRIHPSTVSSPRYAAST